MNKESFALLWRNYPRWIRIVFLAGLISSIYLLSVLFKSEENINRFDHIVRWLAWIFWGIFFAYILLKRLR